MAIGDGQLLLPPLFPYSQQFSENATLLILCFIWPFVLYVLFQTDVPEYQDNADHTNVPKQPFGLLFSVQRRIKRARCTAIAEYLV